MKKVILLLVGVSFSPFTFAQTVSTFSEAIDQKVAQQMGVSVDSLRSDSAGQTRRVTVDPKDTRIVYVGGKPYQLRTKKRFLNGVQNSAKFDTHTYVSPNDTMTVELSQADFDTDLRKKSPAEDIPAGFTVTSDEELQNTREHKSHITACEKRNPDGSCEYIVKKQESHLTFQPMGDGWKKGIFHKGTVTVRKTYVPGVDASAQRANTYQSLKNTPVYSTFSVNANSGGPNDIYGPESY